MQTFFPFYDHSNSDLLFFEKKAKSMGYKTIAGLYVEGKNAWAGPLVAATCILPKTFSLKLSEPTTKLYHQIISRSDLFYSIEVIEPEQIRESNLFQASKESMKTAVSLLSHHPDFILIDGTYSPFDPSFSQVLLQGDLFSLSIACAAVLAKFTRDAVMDGYDAAWPEYGFSQNKGYPTPQHIKNLKHFGPSPAHIQQKAPSTI